MIFSKDERIKIEGVVRAAGDAVMEFYRGSHRATTKADGTPVTEADITANTILTNGLTQFGFPVLSEEVTDNPERMEHDTLWIIDPLDGTKDFIDKTNDFAIMAGLAQGGVPVFGAVFLPAHGVLYTAEKNGGAYCTQEGKRARLTTSGTNKLKDARVVTSRSHMTQETAHILQELGVKKTVPVGSNGVKIGYIAEGKADVFINPTGTMGEWDMCAPQIILEEAGGTLTDMKGAPHVYNKEMPKLRGGIVASNGLLHDSLISHTEK